MADATMVRVRECGECGVLAGPMDTRCQSCLRAGTLRDRLQCPRCRRVQDEMVCNVCGDPLESGLRAGWPAATASQAHPSAIAGRDSDNHESFAQTNEPPRWLVGAIGGGVVGIIAGALATHFLGENPVIGGALGLLPGAFLGGLLTPRV